MRLPQVANKLDYIDLRGGVDQSSPALEATPGSLRDSNNFDVNILGGYRRIDGYEKYDGSKMCDTYGYYTLAAIITTPINEGQTIVGATSGATGYVLGSETGFVYYTLETGTFLGREDILVNGSMAARSESEPYQRLDRISAQSAALMAKSSTANRANTQTVPGAGAIRGLAYYGGALYAFRNNADNTACACYKSSVAGWVSVSIGVHAPNGRFKFVVSDFGAGELLFWCSGVDKARQFDGTTVTTITTGMTDDRPNDIQVHKNHLFLAFGNSLQHSSIGAPLVWSAVTGAAELNIGSRITNMKPQSSDAQSGGAMMISARNELFVLYGNSSADWKLVTFQHDSGALENTMQNIAANTYFLDDRGITNLSRAQEFGNFQANSISEGVRQWLVDRKSNVIDSCVVKEKNQMRLFFSGGTGMHITFKGTDPSGLMPVQYAHNITLATSTELTDGTEAVFYGDDSGNVYLADRGASFAGDTISAFFKLQFNNCKSPRVQKRFRKAVFEVGGSGYADFSVGTELGYSTPDVLTQPLSLVDVNFAGSRWDDPALFWDSGVWDGRVLLPVEVPLDGTEENIGITVYQSSAIYMGLNFQSLLLAYTPRRYKR